MTKLEREQNSISRNSIVNGRYCKSKYYLISVHRCFHMSINCILAFTDQLPPWQVRSEQFRYISYMPLLIDRKHWYNRDKMDNVRLIACSNIQNARQYRHLYAAFHDANIQPALDEFLKVIISYLEVDAQKAESILKHLLEAAFSDARLQCIYGQFMNGDLILGFVSI